MKRSLRVVLAGLFLTFTLSFAPLADATTPSLVSPENGTTIDTLTPRFDWSDVGGAGSYMLEIATDKNFLNTILTKSATESTATLSETEKLSYGTHYYWRVRAKGDFGTGDWSSTWSFTAKLTVPKVTSFDIAAGATYTNSTDVQLTITAQNAAEMSFSNDGVVWDEWEPFQASKSYALLTGDGPKNVYIRVRDNVGDIGQTVVGSITLDQTPPSTTYSLSGDLGVDGFKDTVVVTLASTDATSGVESTKYQIDDGEWRTGITFVISETGWHTIKYYSTDAAGNAEGTKKFELKVYTPTLIPSLLSQAWWALLSIVATSGIVSVFVTRRVRFASRLKQIKRKKAELLKLKRRAEMRYFHEGTISRETYDALIKDYERRRAKLENEQSLLLAKRKRKR
ncbi:MAG: OmpL47-type beta-barrel domain-containing protein [Candidatus Hadarchaeaceae archaeon]